MALPPLAIQSCLTRRGSTVDRAPIRVPVPLTRERIGAQLEARTTRGLARVLPGAPGLGASTPSMCMGVLFPDVTQSPLPFHPAVGSSMRPSIPLAKKPIG